MTRTNGAIVVSAGLAGLTAAYYLHMAGWKVTVLESACQVGGRAAPVRLQGYVPDIGATQMSSGYHEYLALCEDLGLLSHMVASSQPVGILRRGRMYLLDKGRYLRTGVWTHTRQPNCFGNTTIWWGIWLVAVAGNQAVWWTFIGPLFNTIMLTIPVRLIK